MNDLHIYEFDGFIVQSYLDEYLTRMLFEYVLGNGLMGRTAPPRKGRTGMAGKLLWEKKFTFNGQGYILQGGGKKLAFFEDISVDDQIKAKENYRRCVICEMRHPESDLVETDEGPFCQPCYEVWHPPCPECGKRVALDEDIEPDDGPFLCEDCAEKDFPGR